MRIEGVAAAALLAAGLGAFALGLLTTLAEASTGISDFLQFNDRVGPLSGKTILATVAYFGALLVFWLLFRDRQLALRPVLVAAVVLLVLGLLGTFPTFFQAFA
jgi:hypothetical protein